MPEISPLIVNGVGVAAAVTSVSSFAPQIVKIIKEKDASSVSLKTYALTVTTFTLWSAYGVMSGAWPVTLANTCALGMSATVLALKWRYGRDA